mmetsp:Transcript_130629/g.418882  ORF Transcript_130629/g.418882 Transcript_130629/m.418882 type:complete len:582 (-) Transcript_130629:102-1847(-)
MGGTLDKQAKDIGLRVNTYFLVFLNSRWVWKLVDLLKGLRNAAATVAKKVDPAAFVRRAFDSCRTHTEAEGSGWPWPDLLTEVTVQDVTHISLDTMAMHDIRMKLTECSLGFLSMTLIRLLIFAKSMTEEVVGLAHLAASSVVFVDDLLFDLQLDWCDTICVLALTAWPVVTLLGRVVSGVQWRKGFEDHHYQHKPYKMDFHAHELVKRPPEVRALAERSALDPDALALALAAEGRQRPSAVGRGVLRALQASLLARPEQAGPGRMVFVTMVYGARLSKYIPGALRRADAFDLLPQWLLFCLDEDALASCRASHAFPELCVAGDTETTVSKFAIIAFIVHSGFGALYLDFDLVLLQDPRPAVLRAAQEAELVLSKDFGSECINIGVTYLKSHPDSADWMQRLLIWMWHHPYEFCQKAFAGLMGLEDLSRYEVFGSPVGRVPRRTFLDPLNQFVTSTVYSREAQGWTGDMEGIVIYHFLDGIGGVDENQAVQGKYVNLYDLFYDNLALNLSDTSRPLWVQDPLIQQHLLWSRQPAPPTKEHICAFVEHAAWPSWKWKQRQEVLRSLGPVAEPSLRRLLTVSK